MYLLCVCIGCARMCHPDLIGAAGKKDTLYMGFLFALFVSTSMLAAAAMSIRQSYQSIGENPTPSAGQGFPIGLLIPLNCCVLPFAFVQRKLKAIPF